jgi:hypothetical protein
VGHVARGTDRLREWGAVLSKEGTVLPTEYERSTLLSELPDILLTLWLDYGGISAERLEILEERLRDDVVSELHSFGGKYVQPLPVLPLAAIDNAGLLDFSCIPRPLMDQWSQCGKKSARAMWPP